EKHPLQKGEPACAQVRLFHQFPTSRFFICLTGLDAPAGKSILPLGRSAATAHQQKSAFVYRYDRNGVDIIHRSALSSFALFLKLTVLTQLPGGKPLRTFPEVDSFNATSERKTASHFS